MIGFCHCWSLDRTSSDTIIEFDDTIIEFDNREMKGKATQFH